MRIVHISTSDIAGGAARAAYRVHTGLKTGGYDSKMLVHKRWSIDPEVIGFVPSQGVMDKVRRKLRRRKIKSDYARAIASSNKPVEQFSDDRTEYAAEPLRLLPPCDIINLHYVAEFVDYEPFFRFFAKERPTTPLVWRLADMAPTTAGCHYDEGCGRFTGQCGACPVLGSTDDNDLTRQIWQRKNHALSMIPPDRLHLVATSNWIAEQAKRSSLLSRFDCTIIPNALDREIFKPRDPMFSRDVLNIPRDARVVLFAADSIKQKRKGFAQLAEAIQGISDIENLVLVSIGGHEPKLPGKRLIHLSKISDDRVLSLAFSAADVFVIPSLQESFGQTVIESMACGTPIVGFASGGITDTVRPGITGYLAPTGDSGALREAIVAVLTNPQKRAEMSEQCRRIALAEYALEVTTKQYVSLYERLLKTSPNPQKEN